MGKECGEENEEWGGRREGMGREKGRNGKEGRSRQISMKTYLQTL